MLRIVRALSLFAWMFGCHVQEIRNAAEIVPLRVGETEVELVVHQRGAAWPAFLVLHDDEQTAVEAGLETIEARGGRLVEVRSGGRRLLTAAVSGRTWRFDPNRMFTDAGAEATLRAQNGSAPPEVVAEVRRFAEAVLELYGAGSLPVLVTLHNNTDGEYSAARYGPGGDLEADAAAVHLPALPALSALPADTDLDDFFFVTERAHYDALAAEGFPAVLQDNERAADDGSLSVWAGRRGVPYVNVEAEHGHRDRQVRMLEALSRVISAAAAPPGSGSPGMGAGQG